MKLRVFVFQIMLLVFMASHASAVIVDLSALSPRPLYPIVEFRSDITELQHYLLPKLAREKALLQVGDQLVNLSFASNEVIEILDRVTIGLHAGLCDHARRIERAAILDTLAKIAIGLRASDRELTKISGSPPNARRIIAQFYQALAAIPRLGLRRFETNEAAESAILFRVNLRLLLRQNLPEYSRRLTAVSNSVPGFETSSSVAEIDKRLQIINEGLRRNTEVYGSPDEVATVWADLVEIKLQMNDLYPSPFRLMGNPLHSNVQFKAFNNLVENAEKRSCRSSLQNL